MLMFDDFFSERLAQLRIVKDVTARDMSLSLGQSENYINMIENKKSFPSMNMFFYICEYLCITPKDFFDTENNNPEKLNEIINDLKRLDLDMLSHIAVILKELGSK